MATNCECTLLGICLMGIVIIAALVCSGLLEWLYDRFDKTDSSKGKVF